MRGKRASARPNSPFAPRGRREQRRISTPQLPLRPFVGEGGRGDEGGQRRPRTPLPLSALAPPHAGQRDPLDEEAL
jgi:hypothetical protein